MLTGLKRLSYVRVVVMSGLLGIALGTGYMTSLRFFGPIGLSEILFAVVLGWLLLLKPSAIIRARPGVGGWVKIYLLFSVVVVFPLMTLVSYLLGAHSELMAPEYVASFVAGVLLMFALSGAIRNGLVDMRVVSSSFLVIFLIGNIVSLVFLSGSQGVRYSGLAENPNQLLFYLASLFLLLAIYRPGLLVLCSPALVYIGVVSGSDAFVLGMMSAVLVYVFLRLFYLSRLTVLANIIVLSFLAAMLALFSFVIYFDIGALGDIWAHADEGGVRLKLMENALAATLYSPVFGWGAGSYSGISMPFEGEEAHNNILDLAMQFGLILPLVLYGIIVSAMVQALRKKQFLIFALLVGFLISGFFHFSARHFVFWVELGVLYFYVFYADSYGNPESFAQRAGHRCVG